MFEPGKQYRMRNGDLATITERSKLSCEHPLRGRIAVSPSTQSWTDEGWWRASAGDSRDLMPGALEDGGTLEDRVATLEAQVADLIRSRDASCVVR